MSNADNFLAHYGVRGMKWGQSKSRRAPGVSSRTNREARRDAKEFSKAKMFYGEGAGTRRKLIKATVESKSKKDVLYKKAFDHHLENQDFGKRAAQARSERRRKDTTKSVAKTARGVKNLALGIGAPVTITSLAVYTAVKNPRVRAVVTNAGKTAYNTAKNSDTVRIVKEQVMKNFGR